MRVVVSYETYIRDLPFSVIRRLAMELDIDRLWEKLLENIPQKLDDDGGIFQPRYTAQQARIFEHKLRIPNCSPTRAILDDWGTQNSTVGHLLQVLINSELISMANYLRTEILQEKQPEVEPFQSPLPDCLLPPTALNAVPSQHRDQVVPAVGNNEEILYDRISKVTDITFGREGEQNDLSISTGSHTKSSYYGDERGALGYPGDNDGGGALSYHRDYASYGDALLGASPNLNPPVETEKIQGKSSEKKLDDSLFRVQSMYSGFTKAGAATAQMKAQLPPVINQTEHLQHINYEDLREITDNFNEVPYEEGGRLIGRGGFGMVHLAIDRDEKVAAVKVLMENKEIQQKQFRAEINTLAVYQHENLLPLMGYSYDGPQPCIVCEYMPNGSLEDRLTCKNGTAPLSASLRIAITKGTARGIVYLNSHDLIHRDIKTANILLDKDFIPKLGDFATTRTGPMGMGATVAQTSIVIGTSAYLAPEAHNFDVSAKLDSYSFGVVLLELITGLPAFDSSRENKDLRSHMLETCDDIMTMTDKKATDWPEACVHSLYSIAEKCLEYRKKTRVLVKQVLPQIESL